MANLLPPRRIETNVLRRLAAGVVVVIGRAAVVRHVLVGEEGLAQPGIAAVVVGAGLLRPHGVDPVGDARGREAAPRRRLADPAVDTGVPDGRHRGGAVEVHGAGVQDDVHDYFWWRVFGGRVSHAQVVTRGSVRENNGEERARDTGTESNKIQVGNDRPLVLSSFPVHRNTFFQRMTFSRRRNLPERPLLADVGRCGIKALFHTT